MEFWGVEVKSGKPCNVEPGEGKVVHLSQACLGEVKDRGTESIYLYVTINGKKIVLGTLCPKRFPQQQFDLAFEKNFELSHSWKKGTVYFYGYICDEPLEDSDYGSDNELEEDIPVQFAHEVHGEPKAPAAKQKVKIAVPENDVKSAKEEDDSSEESDTDLSSSDADEDEDSETESSEGEGDEEKAEETPRKVEKVSKKRPAEFASGTSGPGKKAKLVTPQKNDNKKGNVHVATPYPSKQAGKKTGNQSKQPTPESGGSHPCKLCNRSFKSDQALESHTKAKHSGGK